MNIKLNGYQKLQLEQSVFSLADNMIKDYKGGMWSFARKFPYWYPNRLSNLENITVENSLNFFSGEMTPRSCGVGLCLIAASSLSFENAKWADYYYYLRDYVYDSGYFSKEELEQITRLID